MHEDAFIAAVAQICKQDNRFAPDAYVFVREALDYAARALEKPTQGPERHVSGAELLESVRAYALQEYGPMAMTVLNSWSVRKTEDFGEIVFNLVQNKVLGKSDNDTKEDFARGYDFEEAFVKPFLPEANRPAKPVRRRAGKKPGTEDDRRA